MVKIFAAISLACSTVGASRSEGTHLLQTSGGVHLENDASGNRAEYLASMKQEILAFAKAGVPESAQAFLDTIKEKLVDDVKPVITAEYDLHVQAHATYLASFTTATEAYNTAKAGAIATANAQAAGAKGLHSDCRDVESGDYTTHTTCVGEQATAQENYDDDFQDVRNSGAASGICVASDYDWRNSASLGTYETHANSYHTAIGELITTRGLLNAKIDECDGLLTDLNTQRDTCDGAQNTFEGKSCLASGAYQSAAATYTSSYDSAKGVFEGAFASWDEQSGDRVAQCKLINTLVCYIDALKNHDDEADLTAAAGECDAENHDADCAAVFFAHDATPAPITPDAVPVAPCDGSFHYVDAWPLGTGAGNCNACTLG